MTTKTVRNAWDSYTDHTTPAKSYPGVNVIRATNVTGKQKHGFLFFTRPFPLGVTIVSAKLHLFLYQDRSGSPSAQIQRVSQAFNRAKLNYNNEPSVAGSVVSVSKTNPKAGAEFVFDVTAIMQLVANGTPWYGFRLASTATAGQMVFFSANAARTAMRPYLEITWSDAPDQPDQLQPSGGRAVTESKPTFSFRYADPSGQDGIQSVQVQIATTEARLTSNPPVPDVWDSGVFATDAASLDSAEAGWSGGVAGTTYWWHVRVTDDSGQTSVWSDPETFTITPKGTLDTVTVDGDQTGIKSQEPTVSWVFSGATQKSYQIFLARTSDPLTILHDSGKKTSTDTAYTIPAGAITQDGATYRVTLRVYDDQPRQATPGNPVYVESVLDLPVVYGATAPVTALNGHSDPIKPVFHITWSYAGDADFFQIQRKAEGNQAWHYGDEVIDPDDALQEDGTYAWDDMGAGMYRNYQWRVVPVVGGVQAGAAAGGENPAISGQVRRLAPFLSTPNGQDIVCFLNPDRSRSRNSQQQIIQPLGGPPVLYTQYVGNGYTGHVEGVFADNVLPGVTAQEMHDLFLDWATTPGQKLKLYVANEVFTVACYNMEIDSAVDGDGLYFNAAFDWVLA